MIEYKNCFDEISAMIDKASEELKGLALNQDRYEDLQSICEMVDRLIDEVDGERGESSVEIDTATLSIAVDCPDLVVYDIKKDTFFQIVNATGANVRFKKVGDDMMRVEFDIHGLWEASVGQ